MRVKSCLACGTDYEVGGRHGRKLASTFCSRKCHQQSRYRKGTQCNELSTADAAYIAGFIDGEGTIMLIDRANGSVGLLVTIANTKRPVMDWIVAVTGVGRNFTRSPRNPKHATAYWWQASGEAGASVLTQIYPYLKIKHEHARMAMGFQERLRVPALKADRSWQQEYRLRMKELNRRGPPASAEPGGWAIESATYARPAGG
jgi:hypothetical protein